MLQMLLDGQKAICDDIKRIFKRFDKTDERMDKIGMDVVLEALKLYKTRMDFNSATLLEYAKICRVKNVMRPYLEAMI